MNGAGQVPTVAFDDGRTLAQSNAIIRYLARDSALIPRDAFTAAKMDEWLFWEQYSHEPYIAVCRFQLVYLGKDASELDPKRSSAAMRRSTAWSSISPAAVSLPATRFRSPTSSLLAYTRVAHEGGFDLGRFAAVRRWIAEAETFLGLPRCAEQLTGVSL